MTQATIEIPVGFVEVDQQLVDDILCAAFEGGINYWADGIEVVGEWPEGAEYASDVLTRGGELKIKTEDGTYILSLDLLKQGLTWFVQNRGIHALEEHDAGDADQIVQYALFEEIVYG